MAKNVGIESPTTPHETHSAETPTTQLPVGEKATPNSNIDLAGQKSGAPRGNHRVTIGVSVTAVLIVLAAAAGITAASVIYLVKKKRAPQSKGFTKLQMSTVMDNNSVAV